MMNAVRKNCTNANYFYAKGYGPYYKHTGATESYGDALADRIRKGEVDPQHLISSILKEMRQSGVNRCTYYQDVSRNREEQCSAGER